MIDYSDLKEKRELLIKQGTADCWKAGEMASVLGIDKARSDFTFTQIGLDTRIDSGVVVFKTGHKIRVVD